MQPHTTGGNEKMYHEDSILEANSTDCLKNKRVEKKSAPILNRSVFEDHIKDAGEPEQEPEEEKTEDGKPVDELQLLINKCKIDITEELDPPPVAMQIRSNGDPVTLFTKGNFSIITGAAKSRKTFLISMLMAAAVKGSFEDLFYCPSSGVNIIFDTEQSRYKTQQIAKRICKLCDAANPSNLVVYSLRTLNPNQRLAVIDEVIKSTPCINFVAIDGIIDLDIDPILQADQAQKIILNLMQWSDDYKIHIACVLHYNKTIATLLGHLGSFSHRKADAVISVTKSKEEENVSLVEPVDCREKEFQPFAFDIDPYGIPHIINEFSFEKKPKEKREDAKPKVKETTFKNTDETTLKEILKTVFKIDKQLGYSDLYRSIKNAFEKVTGETIGDNKAKDFVTGYLENESVIKTEIPNKKPVYTLPGQAAMFE